MPIKDKEENRKYQREWARKNSKTKKANQVGAKRRKQMVDDAKSHPCVICNKDYPVEVMDLYHICLLYTSPSPRDGLLSRMPSSA